MSLLKKHWLSLLAIFALIVFIQLVGSAITFPNISSWYSQLQKPSWTPPNGVFGPVWTILYLMLTYVGWRLWISYDGRIGQKLRQPVLNFFFVQLFFNFLWSPVFFGLHLVLPALLILGFMIAFTFLTFIVALRINRVAAYMLVPYFLWLCYAASLNAAIIVLN